MLKDQSVLMWRIKCTTPLPFVHEKKFIPNELLMPAEDHKWEEYLLQLYNNTLTALLEKQKASYDTEQSKKLRMCNKEVVDVFLPKLKYLLTSTSMTLEEIKKSLEPCTGTGIASCAITSIRLGLEKANWLA